MRTSTTITMRDTRPTVRQIKSAPHHHPSKSFAMTLLRSFLVLTGSILLTVRVALPQTLPVFAPGEVRDTFFGTVVSDPYRGLETINDPKVAEWMKAHADHARRTLDSLPGYAPLKSRIA